MIPMHKRFTIKNLIKLGYPKKRIAEEMECHRNTVRNIELENPVKERVSRNKSNNRLNDHKEFIQELLDKKLSLVLIHQKLMVEKNYQNGYDSLRKYVKNQKLKPSKVYIVLQTEPGEEAQVDFGYVGMTPDNYGKFRKTYIFEMLLSFSRKGFYKAVYDQKTETFIDCFVEAFEYFSGVPSKIKLDNLKAAILKANFYEPEYQKEFERFSKYYGFINMPCKVRRPEEKGKVESGIKYVKNNFFASRQFKDGTDLNCQLRQWREKTCNQRIHGTTKKVPEILFETQEKNKLKKLPELRWETYHFENRKVGATCHIVVDANYYSVPYKFVGEKVQVKINKNLVAIYFKDEKIAVHERLDGSGRYQTNPAHYPEYKNLSQTEYQYHQGQKMKEMGEYAYHYFQKLIEKYPDDWGRKVSGIVHLSKKYDKEVVNLSCYRALQFEVYSYHVIANICEKGLFQENMNLNEEKNPVIKTGDFERSMSYYTQIFII